MSARSRSDFAKDYWISYQLELGLRLCCNCRYLSRFMSEAVLIVTYREGSSHQLLRIDESIMERIKITDLEEDGVYICPTKPSILLYAQLLFNINSYLIQLQMFLCSLSSSTVQSDSLNIQRSKDGKLVFIPRADTASSSSKPDTIIRPSDTGSTSTPVNVRTNVQSNRSSGRWI